MSFKKTLTLLIVLILVASYYYIYEVKISARQEKAAQEAKQVFQVAKNVVNEFSYTKDNGFHLIAKKIDGNWRIIQPIETNAEQTAIEKFVQELAEAKVDRVVEENPKDLSAYGLDKPFIKVAFKTEKDSETLSLGHNNVTGSFVYGQKGDEKKVLFLYATLRSDLDKSFFDLRDKSLLHSDSPEVDSIKISHGDLNIVIKQNNNREWSIIEPANYKADGETIHSILMKLKNERIKEFVAEKPEDLQPYGLDNPIYRVSVALKENKGTRTILFGSEKAGKDQQVSSRENYAQGKGVLYAQIEGEPAVFLVSSDIARELPRKLNDLRYKQILSLDRNQVQRLKIEGTEMVELVKEEESEKAMEKWKLVEPIEAKAEVTQVSQLLYSLRDLKVEDFIEDSPGNLSLYGLDKPRAAISYWTKGEEKPKSLFLGNEAEGGKGVFIKLSDSDAVYTISKEKEKALVLTAFDLQDRTILDIKMEKVKQVDIKYPDGSIRLVKDKQQWRIPSEEAKANDAKIWDLLWALSELKYVAIVSPEKIEKADLGFDTPQVVITLAMKDEPEVVMTIGKYLDEGQKVYFQVKSKDSIYAIDRSFLEKLPKKPSDMLG